MNLKIFGRKKPAPPFIEKPIFDSRVKFVSDLYNYAYYPPIQAEELEKVNITGPGRALSNGTVNIVKAIAYQLYQVPAVRNYYGKDFVHGFSAKIDSADETVVRYDNLDDTPESIEYTKEITAAVQVILKDFLDKYDLYLFYRGDNIQFLTADQMKKIKHSHVENHIVWVD